MAAVEDAEIKLQGKIGTKPGPKPSEEEWCTMGCG